MVIPGGTWSGGCVAGPGGSGSSPGRGVLDDGEPRGERRPRLTRRLYFRLPGAR